MTQTEIEIIRKSWEHASEEQHFWFVVINDKYVYLENPEDLGIEDGHIEETMLRIFREKADAQRYANIVGDHQMLHPTEVKVYNRPLSKLFKIFKKMDQASRKSVHQCSCRLELCSMAPNEWPKSIDTLWTSVRWRN